jgi:hypothetical protein
LPKDPNDTAESMRLETMLQFIDQGHAPILRRFPLHGDGQETPTS